MKSFIALVAAVLILGVDAQTGPCAAIRTKSHWGSRVTNPALLPNLPPDHFVIHHSAGNRCATQAQCDIEMRRIQNSHMDSNGWADIGYNFCIGDNAVIYEGRGWNRQGAHAPGFNSHSIGFCFFGDFSTVLPPVAARNVAQAFVICARDWGRLSLAYRLINYFLDILIKKEINSLIAH